MKLLPTCRDVTRLVLEGEDRPLSRTERWALRVHWLICDACRHFRKQTADMRVTMDRWRQYRDQE